MADTDKLAAEMLDRFERAAMAYERLGKLTKDDEKTREIRKAAIAELADARRAIFDILSIFDPSDVAWFEEETFAELNKRKTAEATITALEAALAAANDIDVRAVVQELNVEDHREHCRIVEALEAENRLMWEVLDYIRYRPGQARIRAREVIERIHGMRRTARDISRNRRES